MIYDSKMINKIYDFYKIYIRKYLVIFIHVFRSFWNLEISVSHHSINEFYATRITTRSSKFLTSVRTFSRATTTTSLHLQFECTRNWFPSSIRPRNFFYTPRGIGVQREMGREIVVSHLRDNNIDRGSLGAAPIYSLIPSRLFTTTLFGRMWYTFKVGCRVFKGSFGDIVKENRESIFGVHQLNKDSADFIHVSLFAHLYCVINLRCCCISIHSINFLPWKLVCPCVTLGHWIKIIQNVIQRWNVWTEFG